MRALMPVTAMLICGCASQPNNPPTAASGAPPATANAQQLTAARNLNLKVVNKDGKQVFCRSSDMTTSRIPRDQVCFTADQLERLQEQAQRDLDQISSRPNNVKGFP